MKEYFYLQYLMINRMLRASGINPVLGFLLLLIVFLLVTEFMFQKSEFAKYLVVIASISLQLRLSEKNRSDFLLISFGNYNKTRIRILENLIISIPFITVLIIKNALPEGLLLIAISVIMAVYSYRPDFNYTLKTPFSRRPFEFAVGFRNSFLIFPFTYTLTFISIYVDNLNLGIFTMLLLFFTTFSYYLKPEPEYYVWVHADTPRSFLIKKIVTAIKNSSLLTSPIVISLLIFYPANYEIVLLLFLAGQCFLLTIILAKYSVYPVEINLITGILIAMSMYFPPLLLAVVPFFYVRASNKLRNLLYDKN